MERSVWTKTNARHQTEGFAGMVTIFMDVYQKVYQDNNPVSQNIMTIAFHVSCMCRIKVPAQIKRAVLNARVQQDLHQVLSEYVKI